MPSIDSHRTTAQNQHLPARDRFIEEPAPWLEMPITQEVGVSRRELGHRVQYGEVVSKNDDGWGDWWVLPICLIAHFLY
jgi:hypothetical protein